MALRDFVEQELDILADTSEVAGDAEMVALYKPYLLDMADDYEGEAYTGTEGIRVAQMLAILIENTFLQKISSQITGDASEWEDSGDTEGEEIIYQNKRLLKTR